MKKILIASIILTSISASAKASDVSLNAGYDYINYSGDHGKRNVSFIELRNKLENGNAVFNLSHGERDYGGGKSGILFVQEQLSGTTGISGYHQEQVLL